MARAARIKVILQYDFPNEMSDEDIRQSLEDLELPKEYVEGSFEYLGVYYPDVNAFLIKDY
tara:strand:- start:322 stop:504 length:183 start_codon:yes stop_codon:yes gene_type:complete